MTRPKKRSYQEQYLPLDEELIDVLKRLRLHEISEVTMIPRDRLVSFTAGRVKRIQRYEVEAIKNYIINYITPFTWRED